jgi:hypothetical protein
MLDTQKFIDRCVKKFGNKFNYDKIQFQDYNIPIEIECPQHGKFFISPKHFLYDSKYGCPQCAIDAEKIPIEDFKSRCIEIHNSKYNYSLIKEYKNNKTKIKIICPIHGIFEQSVQNHLKGQGCPICAQAMKNKKKALTQEDFIKKSQLLFGIDTFDYSNVVYVNNKTPIVLKCNTCQIKFSVRPDNHLYNHSGCPHCFKPISQWEKEVGEFLSKNNIEYIKTDRSILNGLEIDYLLPQHNIGIECNGLLYHSVQYSKNKDYHINKTNLALSKGVNLIHIFEDEWNNQQEIVKSIILNKLRLTPRKIYAKQCEIREVQDEEKEIFLISNNIFGNIKNVKSYGLYHNNILCYIMCVDKNNQIIRANSLNNLKVVGGFFKLLKYIINITNQQVKVISDKRYFNCIHSSLTLPPKLWGIQNKLRINKKQHTKYQIYDCGYDINIF